jgi:hypothetical protein
MPHRLHFNEQRIRAFFYLALVPALILATLILGVNNWRNESNRALNQARINEAQISLLKVTDHQIRHALTEVCRTQTITFGILNAVVSYFANQYPHPSVNQRIIKDTLSGYTRDLSAMTACEDIFHP